MIPLSKRFSDRVNSLFSNQQYRAREKKNKNGRVIRQGYALGFDRKQLAAWLLDKFGGENNAILCPYCRRPIDVYNCDIDHAVPLRRGGNPGLGNQDPVCSPCNSVKGKMTPEEMLFFLAKMQEMGNHFHNGIAVQDITHRLESYSKMKATVNRGRAQKQQAVIKAAVGEDDNF